MQNYLSSQNQKEEKKASSLSISAKKDLYINTLLRFLESDSPAYSFYDYSQFVDKDSKLLPQYKRGAKLFALYLSLPSINNLNAQTLTTHLKDSYYLSIEAMTISNIIQWMESGQTGTLREYLNNAGIDNRKRNVICDYAAAFGDSKDMLSFYKDELLSISSLLVKPSTPSTAVPSKLELLSLIPEDQKTLFAALHEDQKQAIKNKLESAFIQFMANMATDNSKDINTKVNDFINNILPAEFKEAYSSLSKPEQTTEDSRASTPSSQEQPPPLSSKTPNQGSEKQQLTPETGYSSFSPSLQIPANYPFVQESSLYVPQSLPWSFSEPDENILREAQFDNYGKPHNIKAYMQRSGDYYYFYLTFIKNMSYDEKTNNFTKAKDESESIYNTYKNVLEKGNNLILFLEYMMRGLPHSACAELARANARVRNGKPADFGSTYFDVYKTSGDYFNSKGKKLGTFASEEQAKKIRHVWVKVHNPYTGSEFLVANHYRINDFRTKEIVQKIMNQYSRLSAMELDEAVKSVAKKLNVSDEDIKTGLSENRHIPPHLLLSYLSAGASLGSDKQYLTSLDKIRNSFGEKADRICEILSPLLRGGYSSSAFIESKKGELIKSGLNQTEIAILTSLLKNVSNDPTYISLRIAPHRLLIAESKAEPTKGEPQEVGKPQEAKSETKEKFMYLPIFTTKIPPRVYEGRTIKFKVKVPDGPIPPELTIDYLSQTSGAATQREDGKIVFVPEGTKCNFVVIGKDRENNTYLFTKEGKPVAIYRDGLIYKYKPASMFRGPSTGEQIGTYDQKSEVPTITDNQLKEQIINELVARKINENGFVGWCTEKNGKIEQGFKIKAAPGGHIVKVLYFFPER
ncbi:MAG: hypothetical protein QXW70_02995 [Candidatus Anstonellales archaeon]